MEYTAIDLNLETTEKLENCDRATIKKWRIHQFIHQLKLIGIGVLIFVWGVIVVIGMTFFRISLFAHGGGLLGSIVYGPRNFSDLMVVLAIVGAIFISPVYILYQVGRLLRRLLKGISKAPKQPVDTVRQFYSKAIKDAGTKPNVNPEAYIYLLDQAKQQFKDIDGFIESYKTVIKKLHQDIKQHFHQEGVCNHEYIIKDIRGYSSVGVMKNYEVDIEVTLKPTLTHGVRTSPPIKNERKVVLIRERCTVAPVGGRWYLTSGEWSGSLVSQTT